MRLTMAERVGKFGCFHWSRSGLEIDEGAQEALGVEDTLCRLADFEEKIVEADREEVKLTLLDALDEERGSCEAEFRTHRDDEVAWAEVRVEFTYGDDGELIRAEGIVFDVTEKVEERQAARRQDQRRLVGIEAAGIGDWEIDLQSGQAYWSDRFREIFGISEEIEPDLAYSSSRIHPDDRQRVLATLAGAKEEDEDYSFVIEYRVDNPKTGLRWVESRGRVEWEPTPEGMQPSRLFGAIVDITERKEELAELESLRVRRLVAVEAAGIGDWELDPQSGQMWLSERARQMHGLETGTAVTVSHALRNIHPDDLPAVQGAMDRALDPQGDGVYRAEFRMLPPAPESWLDSRGRVQFEETDEGRVPIRMVGAMVDVTERKRAEEMLERASRDKDRFLAMLGHELRNPVAAIRSAADLLAMLQDTTPVVDHVRQVLRRQSRHMARLVDGLLDVSRIAQGKFSLERSPVDLRQVVLDLLADREEQLKKSSLQLDVEAGDEPLWVDGDIVRLTQVVDNLVMNAAKFTEAGGEISVRVGREQGEVVLRVTDTGRGISPEMLPLIFEPFAQGPQQLDRPSGGLGLGLALARGIVELHGGTITVHSEGLGKGASFEVRLPPGPAPVRRRPQPVRRTSPHARRVLLVEDNHDAGDLLARSLRMLGHDVELVGTGKEALDLLHREPADVVLCDLGLPGMTGFDVARAVRSDPELQDTRLIALTGYGNTEARTRSSEAGFDEHLVKPIDIDTLDALLNL